MNEAPMIANRQLLATLVDQMLEPTVFLDFEGVLIHGNAMAAAVMGLPGPADIPGMSLAQIMHPDSLAQAAIDLGEVANSEAQFSASYMLLVDDRNLHPIHQTVSELKRPESNPGTGMDVTQQGPAASNFWPLDLAGG